VSCTQGRLVNKGIAPFCLEATEKGLRKIDEDRQHSFMTKLKLGSQEVVIGPITNTIFPRGFCAFKSRSKLAKKTKRGYKLDQNRYGLADLGNVGPHSYLVTAFYPLARARGGDAHSLEPRTGNRSKFHAPSFLPTYYLLQGLLHCNGKVG
jgi:hypothetical protein